MGARGHESLNESKRDKSMMRSAESAMKSKHGKARARERGERCGRVSSSEQDDYCIGWNEYNAKSTSGITYVNDQQVSGRNVVCVSVHSRMSRNECGLNKRVAT